MSDFEKKYLEFKKRLSSSHNSKDIESIRTEIFSKNGFINSQFKKLASLSQEDKKNFASSINKVKQELLESLIGENNSSFPVFINPGFILFFVSNRKIYFFLYPFFNLDLINFSTSTLAAAGDLAFFIEVCPLVPTFP